ncbi:winged helix-turn-helix domain-containing protein [Saccharothrix sp. S26]|uniref:winged helix-turn-helix domain-containing protein n=1 Tax=Saccharothrix sp. S26 TaxID=2907215 RepID=UPI001F30EF74|nr:winged helix-turn-helix domain-containing protein [Saccharothrix sp. S26]MCE6999138.1 winged helix-turn-helix domain-containing protein [Saccharothrix sp. S26]
MTALPEVTGVDPTDVEVTVVIRVSATDTRVVAAAGRLAEALRSALDLPDADVVVDLPSARVEPTLRILVDSRRVLHRGVPVGLTRLEFDLLHHLCANPHRVHRRTALMASVWGTTSTVDTRTVDVHVRRIRHKLGEAASIITTVRGVGYRVDHAGDVVVERDAPIG